MEKCDYCNKEIEDDRFSVITQYYGADEEIVLICEECSDKMCAYYGTKDVIDDRR